MTIALDALLGTLSIFAFNVVLAVAFAGLGLALRRAFGLARATLEDCFLAFWMGWGIVLLFLMLWNFVFPVGPAALAIVLAAAITTLAFARRDVIGILENRPLPRWSVLAIVFFGLWVANLSIGRLTYWDSALYHMQGVKWARSYPAVPGLANLFGPMGFNNSTFLYNALVDVGPWSGRPWHVSNGLLIWIFGGQIIASAARFLDSRTPVSSLHVFPLLLLPEAVNSVFDGRVSSFATVVPGSLVVMVTGIYGYWAFSGAERPEREKAYDIFCIVALGAIAVSIKSSNAVFAAAVAAISCIGVGRLGRTVRGLRARVLVWSLAAVTVIGLAWAARGVVLSGYALFPSPALSLPVDWRAPAEHARAEFDFVVHSALATADWNYAYVSGRATSLRTWFPHWAHGVLYDWYDIVVPCMLVGLASLVLIASYRKSSDAERAALGWGWLFLAPPVAALAAWATVAPMPHYGAPFFWTLAAVLGSQAFRLKQRSAALTKRAFVAGCLLGITPCLVEPVWLSWPSPSAQGVLAAVVEANLKLPDPGHWFQVGEPAPELSVYTTRTGLVLNVPLGYYARCWDAPLPCTPNPAPNLRQRVPGHIEKGFAVDGDWQMVNWPEAWRRDLLPAMRQRWRTLDGPK